MAEQLKRHGVRHEFFEIPGPGGLPAETCEEIHVRGQGLVADLSGPNGVPDCYVNLFDLAAFASEWSMCNDPQGPCPSGLCPGELIPYPMEPPD